ncbi:hypothetical protein [Niabella sp.]|uniref:hypothetical protein n=1 Tax=Niabella sp. TaxID=1962976 RepID=UPI002622893A|nr:hypothetical protein [Niabella sp.]
MEKRGNRSDPIEPLSDQISNPKLQINVVSFAIFMVAADTLIAPAALFCDIVAVKADTKSAHLRL